MARTNMKKIGWIEVHLKKQGSLVYNESVRQALARDFEVELVDVSAHTFQKIRYLKIPEALSRACFLKGKRGIWVRDFYSTLTLPFDRTKGKQIAIMHHLDFSGLPRLAHPFFWVAKIFFWRVARKLDAIVVVSQYWKSYFEERGFSNIHLIYNGFDLSLFDIKEEEVTAFKEKYGLAGKPIVYLGNCQKPKGVVEAYYALEDLDVHLVTSGKVTVKLAAKNLELEYREYLTLLKSCSVVLVMSKFQEGWNRTAHEAMLLKRPVIGSGRGGMEELLRGGEQIICEDFSLLRQQVERLLHDEKLTTNMGERGYAFAKDFTEEKMCGAWKVLMQKLLTFDDSHKS